MSLKEFALIIAKCLLEERLAVISFMERRGLNTGNFVDMANNQYKGQCSLIELLASGE